MKQFIRLKSVPDKWALYKWALYKWALYPVRHTHTFFKFLFIKASTGVNESAEFSVVFATGQRITLRI
jgi:hypothetical protein